MLYLIIRRKTHCQYNLQTSSSSSSFCCNWYDPVSVVSAHYDSRFAWLLLIQQSRPALKLLTVSALTTSLGKLFQKLAERLKKKFSRWTCFVVSFWYLKRCPLVWFCWTTIVLLVSNLSMPLKILNSWIMSPLCLLSDKVVKSRATHLLLKILRLG